MNRSLVLTLLGADRPGLVESVAARVSAHGGSWTESRMARMAGEFAGILRIDVPEENARELVESLGQLDGPTLRLIVKAAEPDQARAATLMRLELLGPDRPGIVREASQALAALGVNVEELHTECLSAPMTGELLFRARATVSLPTSVDHATLSLHLERLADELTLEVELTPADPSPGLARG